MNAAPTRALAIVGPTASGKSGLAMALAARFDHVELISVDSMQVYREMDIGTAKPSLADQASVPHHLLDLLDPGEESSVAWFAEQAAEVHADLADRSATAVYVGGTGLYHRAVVDGLDIPGRYPEVVDDLESDPDTAGLHQRLIELDPVAAARIEPTNRRRVIRALEVTLGSGRAFSDSGPGLDDYPPSEVALVGLRPERDRLTPLIEQRLDEQLTAGFVDEVARLGARSGGWSRTARQALGYRELVDVVSGTASLEDRRSDIVLRTRRFAVRQLRWFGRDPRITWFDPESPALVDDVAAHWAGVA